MSFFQGLFSTLGSSLDSLTQFAGLQSNPSDTTKVEVKEEKIIKKESRKRKPSTKAAKVSKPVVIEIIEEPIYCSSKSKKVKACHSQLSTPLIDNKSVVDFDV
jgi:hypothetical protein